MPTDMFSCASPDTSFPPCEFTLYIGDQATPITTVSYADIGCASDATDEPVVGTIQSANDITVTMTCHDDNAITRYYQIAYGYSEKVCRYFVRRHGWSSVLGKITEAELLKLIPNNVKRRMGLPTTRGCYIGRTRKRNKQTPISLNEIKAGTTTWRVLSVEDIAALKHSSDLMLKKFSEGG